MRMSRLFSQTLREVPAEADIASHRLLLRAGFVRQLSAGVFSYLPLAQRSLRKIQNIIRAEMDAIGGQEIVMPIVHPADIWQQTGRWYEIGPEMTRLQDRHGRDMALAMTHEEVITDLVRQEVRSYRQLPLLLYQLQTKWRDEARPRAGLIRVREFTMKDSYSLDADWEGLDKQYRAHYQAYFNIYHRCGLPAIAVQSDVGMMGGRLAHEFMFLTPVGEDTLLLCAACGYRANREVARFQKSRAEADGLRPVEKIETPETTTIEALARFLDIPEAKTAKALFLMATLKQERENGEKFVFAVVRGDMELNEAKLMNAVKAKTLRPATDDEIRAIGAVPGYGSPVGVRNALIVVDDAIPESPNLVAGANEVGFHLLNVNCGRDYQADIVADIVAAQEGDLCPACGSALKAERGVEVGNIFKLGTRYSEAMGATYLDRDGQAQAVIMGSYGIGVGRLLACIAEAHHDDNGLIWPVTIAPYPVHLVLLPGDGAETVAESLYDELRSRSIEVLYDDRDERAGVKFNDADLIGVPIRLTVSKRSLEQGGVEFKRRDDDRKKVIPSDEIVERVAHVIDAMQAKIDETVVEVPLEA